MANEFTYFAYDLLSGRSIGQLPLRGVTFGQQLNQPGQLQGTIDLDDPRVQLTDPLSSTAPNRTLIVVDYKGAIVWGGIVLTRKRDVSASLSSTTRTLTIQCSELWSYFQYRVQATDYSSPPYSNITGPSTPMTYWNPGPTGGPWDATLIATQVIHDALNYSVSLSVSTGNPLNGLTVLVNGATPSSGSPVVPSTDYVAITYPYTSEQTVDSIVTQLSQLGLGVGFDFGVDLVYSGGPGSSPTGTINISYPRRGRTVAQNFLMIDLQTARQYSFPEDGTQAGNQVYEIGGSGAITVSQAAAPLGQGYPLWERVISRSQIQSQHITSLLSQTGLSDLALYAYAPVTPSIKLGLFDPNLPIGSFTIGDDVQVRIPQYANRLDVNGNPVYFDPRFPAGMDQEWRIIQWQATVNDDGDSTLDLTLNLPPFTTALAPAI